MTSGNPDVRYSWFSGHEADEAVLKECARLFSEHYGRWSAKGRKPGDPIRLSAAQLRAYLPEEESWAVTARVAGQLVGYAFAVRARVKKRTITWVTQLVVHTDFQNRGIAKTMLNSIWGFSDHYAWGIASANPYAVRALEKATKRRCRPMRIRRQHKAVLAAIGARIPYLCDRDLRCTPWESVIDTKFFQDHGAVRDKIARTTQDGVPWLLGQIREGEEWLAITFNAQKQIRWTEQEFESFVAAAFNIVRDAYDRMAQMQPERSHPWARHAKAEVDFIQSVWSMEEPASVVDFGCGTGRHSLELARRGHSVTGIDFSPAAVDSARGEAVAAGLTATFLSEDCRTVDLGKRFDIALCLYDVIGSFPDQDDNMRILDNVSRHIKSGGLAFISVMSLEYTRSVAKYKADIVVDSEPLSRLKVGTIMQDTGDVFDPDYFVLDEKKRVVYRKERFDTGEALPTELIVRDRRYELAEIAAMCERVGIHPIHVGFVSAGKFHKVTQPDTKPTKEILVKRKKNSLL